MIKKTLATLLVFSNVAFSNMLVGQTYQTHPDGTVEPISSHVCGDDHKSVKWWSQLMRESWEQKLREKKFWDWNRGFELEPTIEYTYHTEFSVVSKCNVHPEGSTGKKNSEFWRMKRVFNDIYISGETFEYKDREDM